MAKKKKAHTTGRVRNRLIPIDETTYLVGATYNEEDEEKPTIIAWLDNPNSQSPEIKTDGVYQQLYEEIFNPDIERSKVITLHLYVEYWLDKIFERISLSSPGKFKRKIDLLNAKNFFEKSLYENLLVINDLRNIYAHELDLTKANKKVTVLISRMILDPYFVSTDRDHFRSICIQTMFLLEATFIYGGKPPKNNFPTDAVRSKLKTDGKLHWQECELLSKEKISRYVHRLTLKCPLCSAGTIVREKDDTPGFRDSYMTHCQECGLTGDGSYLDLKTATNL